MTDRGRFFHENVQCKREERAPVQPTLETNAKTAVLPIACYPWGGTYRPAAWAQCGLDGESLYLLLWCQEDNRDKPRYLHDNEPVYTDSCLGSLPGLLSAALGGICKL